MTVRQARARLCGAAVFPLLMAGCALFEPQEVIENRYKTLKVAPPETEADALILSVITSASSSNKPGIKFTELIDRAQAALVTETKGKPPLELKAAKESAGDVVQASSVSRKVLFSLRPQAFLFKPKGQTARQLEFASLDQVSAFQTWLRRALPNGGLVANGEIGLQDSVKMLRPMIASDLEALAIIPSNDAKVRQVRNADTAGCDAPQTPVDDVEVVDDAAQ